MYCIIHSYCPKAVENGHCSVYSEAGVAWRNHRGGQCDFATLPEAKTVAPVKKINALKASKRAATGVA